MFSRVQGLGVMSSRDQEESGIVYWKIECLHDEKRGAAEEADRERDRYEINNAACNSFGMNRGSLADGEELVSCFSHTTTSSGQITDKFLKHDRLRTQYFHSIVRK